MSLEIYNGKSLISIFLAYDISQFDDALGIVVEILFGIAPMRSEGQILKRL
jgi:hypothetical protein